MAAPAAIGEVAYRDTTELDAECALVAGAPFAETFMTAASPGIVVVGDGEPALRRRATSTCAPSPTRSRTEYRAIVDRGLLLQIDAPDLAMERHTLFADRPLDEFLDWVELVIDAINGALDGIDPGRRAAARVLGQLRGSAHPRRRRSTTILPLLYEAHVGALVMSMANARHAHEYRCFERRPAARRHGARRRRDRHDEQLRRAPRGRGRPARAGRARRSAIRAASSPAPTAASTPRPASATSRRRWCGRSCGALRAGADLATTQLFG